MLCTAGISNILHDASAAGVLRGALALLLRSVKSASPDHNFCSLCQHEQLRSGTPDYVLQSL